MRARQMHRPMERHDGLAGAGRARDTRRAAVLPFDELPLGRVQEDGPLLPGVGQRPLQRLHIRHHPEAAPLISGPNDGGWNVDVFHPTTGEVRRDYL